MTDQYVRYVIPLIEHVLGEEVKILNFDGVCLPKSLKLLQSLKHLDLAYPKGFTWGLFDVMNVSCSGFKDFYLHEIILPEWLVELSSLQKLTLVMHHRVPRNLENVEIQMIRFE